MGTTMLDVARRDAPRDDEAFVRALRRARAEFMEMPGLARTLPQAARLWAMDAATCAAVLAALEESRFLVRAHNASFIRA
jgi:hypothetical protein